MTEVALSLIVGGWLVALFVAFYYGSKHGHEEGPCARAVFGWGVFLILLAGHISWEIFEGLNGDLVFWGFVAASNIVAYYFMGKFSGQWAKATGHGKAWAFLIFIPLAYFFMLFAKPEPQINLQPAI